jgi:hypothetical protein
VDIYEESNSRIGSIGTAPNSNVDLISKLKKSGARQFDTMSSLDDDYEESVREARKLTSFSGSRSDSKYSSKYPHLKHKKGQPTKNANEADMPYLFV